MLSYDVKCHMIFLNFLSRYMLVVYTSTGTYMSGTVYDGISRHMTVYPISVKVHTSIYWYILVHTGTSEYIHFLFKLFCSLLIVLRWGPLGKRTYCTALKSVFPSEKFDLALCIFCTHALAPHLSPLPQLTSVRFTSAPGWST
jgi:hypothetical protein